MSVYLLNDFSDDWFSQNPLYRPCYPVSCLSANASPYMSIPLIKEGRNYTLIPCQRDFTILERVARFIAALAFTVFSAFFGLFSEALRRTWGEALNGNGRVDIIFPTKEEETPPFEEPLSQQGQGSIAVDWVAIPRNPGEIESPLAEIAPRPLRSQKAERLE